jgi:hypothetical protein
VEGIGGSSLAVPGGGADESLVDSPDDGGGIGGGDASVAITTAQYLVNDDEFRVEGTVTGATWVTLYDGGMAGGKCKGRVIVTTDVGRGTFLWRAEDLDPVPTKVCVTTSGGAVNATAIHRID